MRTPLLYTLALLLAVGCSGGEEEAKKPEATRPTEAPTTEPPPPPPTLALQELTAQAENIALVPSPAEMQRALEKAGIAQGLSALVPDRKLKLDLENKDVVAVRTGVVLADALLTVKDAPKDKLIERLERVKTGLTSLGAGTDLAATLDDLISQVRNEGVSRDDLLKQLDEIHGAVIPELKQEIPGGQGERLVPLIQAGSWLAGSNLVAQAIVTAEKPEAGTQLLRQPQVADYFLKYVKVEGGGKAPDEVLKQLETTLTRLKEIAGKPSLTLDDVKEVKSQTDSVMTLL